MNIILTNEKKLFDRPIIKFKNLNMKYKETGKVVLKKVNISIKKGEKIAVVGRTGARKSSLLLSLFRLV